MQWVQQARGGSACSLHSAQNVREGGLFAGLDNDDLGCVDAKESSSSECSTDAAGSRAAGGAAGTQAAEGARGGSGSSACSLYSVQNVVGGGPVIYSGVAVTPGHAAGGASRQPGLRASSPQRGTRPLSSAHGDSGGSSGSTSVCTGMVYGEGSVGGSAANSVQSGAEGWRSVLDGMGLDHSESRAEESANKTSSDASRVGAEQQSHGSASSRDGRRGGGSRRLVGCGQGSPGPLRMPGWEQQADGVVRFVGWAPARAPGIASAQLGTSAAGSRGGDADSLSARLQGMSEALSEFSSLQSH